MNDTVSRWIPLSPARRLLGDVAHFAQGIPTATAERRMRLAAVTGLRAGAWPRPGWCAVFVKAYAVLAQRRRELRQVYVRWPWPHLIEHPVNAACVPVHRSEDDGDAVYLARLDSPEQMGLGDIDRWLRDCQERPIETLPAFHRWLPALRLAAPLRTLFCRCVLPWSGALQANMLGTYGINTVGSNGATCITMASPWTVSLSYGMIGRDGAVDVRMTYDQRVRDAATVANLLHDLEDILCKEIAAELRYLAAVEAA